MSVGFVHGVMNTDNMSILGLTIDYGPYGWLEDFDPGWTPNTTDAARKRYRYGNQPQIGHWNLMRLANALVPLFDEIEPLQEALDGYSTVYTNGWVDSVDAKLGWGARQDGDDALVDEVFELLQRRETDMTVFFRALGDVDTSAVLAAGADDATIASAVAHAWYPDDPKGEPTADDLAATASWLRKWSSRLTAAGIADDSRRAAMHAVNPKYVLRNALAQVAIDKATQGDASEIDTLLDVLRHPFDEQPGRDEYAAVRPEWARVRPGCSMLSCSS